MSNRSVTGLGILFIIVTSLACNAFAGRGASLPPPPNPTVIPVVATQSSQTVLAPTVTLPPELPFEATQGSVRILVDLNIRSGPGVRFDRVGFMLKDERATVMGVDPASGWWRIQCPPTIENTECWVSGGSQFTLFASDD